MSEATARRIAANFVRFSIVIFAFCIPEAIRAETSDVIVVTADRLPVPAANTGSAVTIIEPLEIEKRGNRGVSDVLRGVSGVEVRETGGTGGSTSVSIRGATPGQTLVLVDGIRVGDPSAIDGSVDFSSLVAGDIEKIEVLRGPQSALYGSDAMGGVINILTRRGNGPPKYSVTLEGGSYGTIHSRGSVSGGTDNISYAFAIDGLHADGFPRYGYRIARPLTYGFGSGPLPSLPWGDPTNRGGATGKISYRLSDSASIEVGVFGSDNSIRFDNPNASTASNVFSPRNHSVATFLQAYTRLSTDMLDGALHNQLTLFGNLTDRSIWQTEGCFDAVFASFDCRSGYRGVRRGGEYQGDLKIGVFGLLTLGFRTETEIAQTSQDPAPAGSFTPINAQQTTNSAFVQHKFSIGDRLDFTYGGRIDAVASGPTFATWRTTASYRLNDVGTRLHASAGTGAKAPSLFQRFSQYGSASLNPEKSFGVDAGVEQKFLDDRLKVDVTVFNNQYRNLIGFDFVPSCTPVQFFGCYYNVGKALTRGIEATGEFVLVPEEWKARATYTFMHARDLLLNAPLYQRPRNQASASLVYSAAPKLEVEGRVTFVGSRLDFGSPPVNLAPYAKFDLLANYKIADSISLFARIENLTNAKYEEVSNYGVAGRSIYGGIKMTW